MEANELRIGNIVKTCTPNMEIMIPHIEAAVQGITIFGELEFCHTPHANGFKMPPKHTIGIPLTEEWLFKFGFEKVIPAGWVTMDEDYYRIDEFVIESRKFMEAFSYQWHKAFKASHNKVTQFKYVHELQNIYHALTGIELKVRDKVLD